MLESDNPKIVVLLRMSNLKNSTSISNLKVCDFQLDNTMMGMVL